MIVRPKPSPRIYHHLQGVRQLELPAQPSSRLNQPIQAAEQPARLTDKVNPSEYQSALSPVRLFNQLLHERRNVQESKVASM